LKVWIERIAEKLKIPSSTVKSKLQVAIGNLKEKISKQIRD
jgi:DNA-directed RNA polymerase specialized sigma24 family protein